MKQAVTECSPLKMPASREFIVITIRAFYAGMHLNRSVAAVISSGSNGSSFETNRIRSVVVPREWGDVDHLHEL